MRRFFTAATAGVLALTLSGGAFAEEREHPRREWRQNINLAIAREGQGNHASITQTGSGNRTAVLQRGDSNDAAITQSGDNNSACLIQRGRNLDYEIAQSGGESVGIVQTRGRTRQISYERCAARVNFFSRVPGDRDGRAER